MKYLYAAIAIALVAAISWFYLIRGAGLKEAPVLVVNQSRFSPEEFEERFSRFSPEYGDRKTFAEALALREILVQEARKRGLDREQNFRLSMQNHYEQSLVQLLIERRRGELEADADPDEIDRYARFVHHRVLLTEFRIDSPQQRENPENAPGRTFTERFDWLPENVRYALFKLDPGQFTTAIRHKGDEIVYRLDGIVMEPDGRREPDRDAIQKFIAGQKTSAAVQKWMEDLKRASRIEILIKE